jgi:Protein of unknown function (DUF1566)
MRAVLAPSSAAALALALGIASCGRSEPPPAPRGSAGDHPGPVPRTEATSGGSDGSGKREPATTARPAVDPWARWPMPNAHLPGLPHPHRYDTTADGVVVDQVTGLMWQRRLPNAFFTFDGAGRHCDEMTLAGHHDWRLPSRIELVSLLDTTRTQPSIDVETFPGTPSDWFWTSSPANGDPSAAWYVYFYFGYPKTDDRGSKFSVRCVRSARAPAPPKPRYAVRTGDVLDADTGLDWQRVVSSKPLPFDRAARYCARLVAAGKKGWRVPTLTELLTIVDERTDSPMIRRAAFPDTPGEPFWSSSTFANGKELAWYVRFDSGAGLYGRLSEAFRVRCVR